MCLCPVLGQWIGNTMYIFEKLSACLACSAVVLCLAATLVIIWAFGVGLGYNHCYIEFKTSTPNALRSDLVFFRGPLPPPHPPILRMMEDYDYPVTSSMRLGESLLMKKIEESSDPALIIRPTKEKETYASATVDESITMRPIPVQETETADALYFDSRATKSIVPDET